MRLQANSNAAATLPAATTKSSRSAHIAATKAAAPAAAAKAATPAAAATPAKVAAAAAAPESYGGAGSLLDAHA